MMVRKPFLAFVGSALTIGLGFLFLYDARSQEPSAPEKAAIVAVLTAQQDAWNKGNVDSFLEGYWHSDALTFSGSSGIFRGYEAVRERYKKGYPDRQAMGKVDFRELEVRKLGTDAALVLGHWHLTREKGDVGGVFSLVFQRFPEGWKIIHDHTSVVTAQAAHN